MTEIVELPGGTVTIDSPLIEYVEVGIQGPVGPTVGNIDGGGPTSIYVGSTFNIDGGTP